MTKVISAWDAVKLLFVLGGVLAFMVFSLVAIAFAGRVAEMILNALGVI
jgi:hypothetical protein